MALKVQCSVWLTLCQLIMIGRKYKFDQHILCEATRNTFEQICPGAAVSWYRNAEQPCAGERCCSFKRDATAERRGLSVAMSPEGLWGGPVQDVYGMAGVPSSPAFWDRWRRRRERERELRAFSCHKHHFSSTDIESSWLVHPPPSPHTHTHTWYRIFIACKYVNLRLHVG